MSYELKLKTNGVIKKFTGTVNDNEFIAATEEVQQHPEFHNFWFVINDLTEVINFEVSTQVMSAYFDSVTGAYRYNSQIKLSFVTDNPFLERQLTEYLLICKLPYRARIFDSLTTARRWCKGKKPKHDMAQPA